MYGRHIKNRRGFTLLELLVAMALTATLIVVAFPAFTFVARYTRSQLDSTSLRGDIRLAAARIREDVRHSGTQSISGEDESILTLDGIIWQVDSGSGVLTRTADGKTDSFSAVGKAAFGIKNFSRSPVVTITLSSGAAPDIPVVFHQAVRPAIALNPGTPPPPPDPGGGDPGDERPDPQPGGDDVAFHWNESKNDWDYYSQADLLNYTPSQEILYLYRDFSVPSSGTGGIFTMTIRNTGNIEIYPQQTVGVTLEANRNIVLESSGGSVLLDSLKITGTSADSDVTIKAARDVFLRNSHIRLEHNQSFVTISAGNTLYASGLLIELKTAGNRQITYTAIDGTYQVVQIK